MHRGGAFVLPMLGLHCEVKSPRARHPDGFRVCDSVCVPGLRAQWARSGGGAGGWSQPGPVNKRIDE